MHNSQMIVVRMPAGFAGSKSLDERRRRRLAQESVDQAVTVNARTETQAEIPASASRTTNQRRIRDESIIPQAPWKVAILATLLVIAWGAMLWAGTSPWPASVGLGDVFSLTSGRTEHLFSTACLLFSAQLSFFILWHRSRSRKDFGGRYRIWAWAGIFWGLTCFASATKIYLPLAGLAYEHWPIECWRSETLFWLGPFSICYLAIHRLLAMEMRTSRTALTLWNLSFWVGIVSAGMHLGLEMLVVEPQRFFTTIACLTSWHAMIAISLLTHARYVAHVTNEASAKVVSVRRKILNWGQQRLTEMKELLRAEDSGVIESENAREQQVKRKSTKPKSSPETDSKPVTVKVETSQKSEANQPDTRNRVLGKSVRMDQPSAQSAPHAIQESPAKPEASETGDEVDYSSLSKKERRRLRKLQKQNSRS